MANQELFQSAAQRGTQVPAASTRNEAGGRAYECEARQALAQYVATGCLTSTFYATAEVQLNKVLELCSKVEPAFIARAAVYARERGQMKDMPALLCAALSVRDRAWMERVFPRVIDDGRMLRNFVQILRSGAVGRRSLGTAPKRLVCRWLAGRSEEQLFRASVGQAPSLADVVKMVHPKPASDARKAFYGYLLGRAHRADLLPAVVQAYEAFKGGQRATVPDVPFQMLTALSLGTAEWTAIARQAPWQATRMNLNTFARHGVFANEGAGRTVAERLRDPAEVKRARVFPYQLLMAYRSAGPEIPACVREALQDAMEIATRNVPAVRGKVYVCPDVSGSMRSPVTGNRPGATTQARCVDVAAPATAALLRNNPEAEVLPFENGVVEVDLNPRDSVMTNAEKLAAVGGGGTNCSAPLSRLNTRGARGDLVVFISDNESWMDIPRGRGTETMRQWTVFQRRNPEARLVCIDLQPYATTQACESRNVLNIGGFSDQVFELLATFAAGRLHPDHWVGVIESITL